MGLNDLNGKNQQVLEPEKVEGILESEKYFHHKCLRNLEGLPKEIPVCANGQSFILNCSSNKKSPQILKNPQLRKKVYGLKKKVFLKPKGAKKETRIRPFQYENKRSKKYNSGLRSIEKALPALRNQFVMSSNSSDVIGKSRWPQSIMKKIRHCLNFEEGSDKLGLFKANTNPILEYCRLSKVVKSSRYFGRQKNKAGLVTMASKETSIDDASISAGFDGEEGSSIEVEMKKERKEEVQCSLLEKVDRLLRFGVSGSGPTSTEDNTTGAEGDEEVVVTRFENTTITQDLDDFVKMEEHSGVVIDKIMDQIEMVSTVGELSEDTEDDFAEAAVKNLCAVLELTRRAEYWMVQTWDSPKPAQLDSVIDVLEGIMMVNSDQMEDLGGWRWQVFLAVGGPGLIWDVKDRIGLFKQGQKVTRKLSRLLLSEEITEEDRLTIKNFITETASNENQNDEWFERAIELLNVVSGGVGDEELEEVFGQDLIGIRGSSPDFEALRGTEEEDGENLSASPHQVLCFNNTENMRGIDPDETDSIPDLTPGTEESDEETQSMFNFSGLDGDRKVTLDGDDIIITRTYTTPEELTELQRCFEDQVLSPQPTQEELIADPDLTAESWGEFGTLQYAGKVCSACFSDGIKFEAECYGEAGNTGESSCINCNTTQSSPPIGGAGLSGGCSILGYDNTTQSSPPIGGAGLSGDGCSIVGYGDGIKIVRETSVDDSDMSGEFEFHSLKSLVDGQDGGIKLELQVVEGAGLNDGVSGHDAMVIGGDGPCGDLPELPAKPV